MKEKEKLVNSDEEETMEPLPSLPNGAKKKLTQTHDLDLIVLKNLNPRWKNWITRFILGSFMIATFSIIVYMGPLAIIALVYLIQLKCFHEIITIGNTVYKSHHLPWFRTLSWYFLLTSNYYLYGDSLIEHFSIILRRNQFLVPLATYHRFISFSLYSFGFVGFVITLKRSYYLKQFTLFGYTHLALLLVSSISNIMIQNVFEGIIWFLLPVALIICNDIMAYMFGFFFGRTQLIQLSPKKTWEGFIGGAFSTVLFGFILSWFLCQHKNIICPLEYDEVRKTIDTNCVPLDIFEVKEYKFFHLPFNVHMYPFQIHALALAVFASTIGPFGGFFASGFKRAFKIKDFGDTIPGHGGFMDRFDCKFIMAAFVNVYIHSFVRSHTPIKLFNQLVAFKAEDQTEFLRLLRNHYGDF